MIENLQGLLIEIEKLTSEVLGVISAAPKVMPGKDLAQQGYILLVIRDARKIYDDAKRDINKVLDKISEQLCQAMVNAEKIDMDVEKKGEAFRLYPAARGHYSVPNFLSPDFAEFYAFIRNSAELQRNAASRGAKRALDGLCDELLENGEPLPPQVKSYIKATIKVRRLRHGRREIVDQGTERWTACIARHRT